MEEQVMEYQNQIKAPRLCVMKREELGYGFNLHGEKGVVGQYISAVDPGGAADKAGLTYGDRVVEVNGVNVEGAKHNDVVQCIRSDPEQTTLLVIDQVTDKYLKNIGKPVTAELAGLASVTELYPPVESSTEDNVSESEIVEKLEELHSSASEISEVTVNGKSLGFDDMHNSEDENEEKNVNESDEENVSHKSIEHERVTECTEFVEEKPSESTEFVEVLTEYGEEKPSESTECVDKKSSESMERVDGKPSEKPAETVYYNDESSVNILAGVESEDNSSLTLKSDTSNNSTMGSFEKVRPKAIPMRKEVKQGDWRAKLALFDQL